VVAGALRQIAAWGGFEEGGASLDLYTKYGFGRSRTFLQTKKKTLNFKVFF
jgi:hypothetical protein